jgi:hypothetical protein
MFEVHPHVPPSRSIVLRVARKISRDVWAIVLIIKHYGYIARSKLSRMG